MHFHLALTAAVLALAACSAPVKYILPGKVDLKLAAGDRIKLCADDGFDDTTPLSDCVIVERTSHPIAPYADELKAKGWRQAEVDSEGREIWTLAGRAACKRLVIDGGREKMTRKRFTLLRFDVSEEACVAS